jgi:uncharacterized repeat protein (TIGR03803 family)
MLAACAWASSETVLYTFNSQTGGIDGYYPYSGVIADATGNTLYGTTYSGGVTATPYGTAYMLKHSSQGWTETVLHNFIGGTGDGAYPYGALVTDKNGNLYGTTYQGGTINVGTVFQLTRSGNKWTEKILHSFAGYPKDGSYPVAGLSIDSAGNLYGTTYQGGKSNVGTVFKLTLSKGKYTFKTIHGFSGGDGGANPIGGLVVGKGGYFYGATLYGGATFNVGTVYTLFQARGVWVAKAIYHFTGGASGTHPYGDLATDAAGNLYGTTHEGGDNNLGTVYKLTGKTIKFTQKTLYSFKGGVTDGEYPYYAGVTLDPKGNIYGTAYQGGPNNTGAVFKLTLANGKYNPKVIHFFGTTGDGYYPRSTLALVKGNLFGTTYQGGAHAGGVAFEVKP